MTDDANTRTGGGSAPSTPSVRFARSEDAPALRDIYAPIVRETAISFAETPPSVAGLRADVVDDRYPWLVCTAGDAAPRVVGFAKASAHKERGAYRWAVDVSAYVRAGWRGRGVGSALYEALLETLTAQGFRIAVAVIALPNPASVALHESAGFEPVGTFPAVGFKNGAWHDVGWWQRSLGDRPNHPTPPVPVARVEGDDRVVSALGRAAERVGR